MNTDLLESEVDEDVESIADLEIELDEASAEFVDELCKKLVIFTEEFCDVEFFPYQVPIAYRMIESIVIGDGEELTVIATRQSGKSEVLSNVIASMMVILPKLAVVYPLWLSKFVKGLWCGVFAPTEDQADTVFSRIVTRLTSDHALEFLLDPEIDDRAASGGARGKGKIVSLKNSGSLCRMQTCNPKAKIESKTYHFAIVDEAQDLTRLQWDMCEKMWKNAKRVYISGDDDQAIFRWAGADVEHLINMKGNQSVLKQSHRCPAKVHKIAQEIVTRIRDRREKEWNPRDEDGELQFHAYPGSVDVSEGNWLLLASCKYMLKDFEEELRYRGLPYTKYGEPPVSKSLLRGIDSWGRLNDFEEISYNDVGAVYSNLKSGIGVARGYKNLKTLEEGKSYNAEELVMHHGLLSAGDSWDIAFNIGDQDKSYIMSMEKHGGLRADAKINLSTIHMAKGGECDNVALMTDLSRANRDEMEINSDDTNRAFYVAVTRAKKSLHIVRSEYGGFIL